MIVCRLDDADRIASTYQSKMSAGMPVKIILSCIVLFFGTMAYGFISMSGGNGSIAFVITVLLIVLLIGSGIIASTRNPGHLLAYVIDDDNVFQVDIPKACANDTLFGAAISITYGSLSRKNKIIKNMKSLPTSSYIDEFVCNRQVAEYSGSVINKVFLMEEGKKFLKVSAQVTAVNEKAEFFPTKKKTLYIPQTFTNIDTLRMRLEQLM